MLRRGLSVALLSSAALSGSSCLEMTSCHDMDCVDSATVTVRSPDGSWLSGNYELELTSAGQTHSCRITLPGDAPTLPDTIAQLACDPPFEAQFVAVVECTSSGEDESVPHTCTLVAGQYFFSARLPRTPAYVDVRLVRDGSELLHESRTLEYARFRPNGPGCEPTCRVATLELVVP